MSCRLLVAVHSLHSQAALHNGQSSLKARASRSKDNIKSNFREISYEDVDWVNLDQDTHKPWNFLDTVITYPFIYLLPCTTFGKEKE